MLIIIKEKEVKVCKVKKVDLKRIKREIKLVKNK